MLERSFVFDLAVEPHDGPSTPLEIENPVVFNCGFTVKDDAVMYQHLDEMERDGIKVRRDPPRPVLFPLAGWALLTGTEVPVLSDRTSGEVEFVLVRTSENRVYVGVGSDHTDRELEAHDIACAKQVAPNVMHPVLWPLEDIAGRYDDIELRSWNDDEPYQAGTMGEFWDPEELLARFDARCPEFGGQNVILFSGTLPALGGALSYGLRWRLELADRGRGRSLQHEYRVRLLAPKDDLTL